MRNKVVYFSALVLSIAALLSLSSCDDDNDDPYYSPLVGGWSASYDRDGVINFYDYDYYNEYFFYDDGTGIYTFYNRFNQLDHIGFTWVLYNNNSLRVYYNNGDYNTFYYNFVRGYLELSPTSSPNDYVGYSPIR